MRENQAMRSFRHWTPRYLMNRLRLMGYEAVHRDAPWLTKDMVGILASWFHPDDRGLEWGSGRSTIWFAKRVSRLISIEHDDLWYQKISARLMENKLSNVDYRLCKEEHKYVTSQDSSPE